MRYYWNPDNPELLKKLQIKISTASFFYGFEYLGVADNLVQTPLTDRFLFFFLLLFFFYFSYSTICFFHTIFFLLFQF